MDRRKIQSLTSLLLICCLLTGGCAVDAPLRKPLQSPVDATAEATTHDGEYRVVRLPPVEGPNTATLIAASPDAGDDEVQQVNHEETASQPAETGTTARLVAASTDTSLAAEAIPLPEGIPAKATVSTPAAEVTLTPAAESEEPAKATITTKAAAATPPKADAAKNTKVTSSAAKSVEVTEPVEVEPADVPTPPAPSTVAPSPRNPLVTIHVDAIDVRKTFEILSRQANLNILVSPGVTGTITLDLTDKTVDETLAAIARLCRLKIHRERDIIFVSTIQEANLAEEDDLPVCVYRLNYVRSSDIEAMIKPLLSKKGAFTASPDCELGLASDAVKAGETKDVKAGSNSLAGSEIVVVQDYEYVLSKVDRIVAQIDVQPLQVLIEAVIVSVKLEKGMELGVNFALLDGASRAVGVLGDGAAINAAAGFMPASVLAAGNTGLLKGTPLSGSAEGVPGLKFGFVDKSTTGFIRALETMGETKVLACPRLMVLNKQRAEIHLGDRLGYATTTQTQTSTVQTVQFQDVGTQLRLRPFISSDGMIRMEVRPERSSGIIDSDGIPQINSAQVTTNVTVPDGATLVIGGLIESEVQDKWAGVPLLSRLPWVGWLFRETEVDTKKKELIVILTPRIWRPEAPEALNYLGRPKTLCLDARVAQRPCEERRDAPTLYELTRPTPHCVPNGPTPVPNGAP